jgi:hypothetical protein
MLAINDLQSGCQQLPSAGASYSVTLARVGIVCDCFAVPNQRAASIKRTTITVDESLYVWAMAEAKRRGINDFSTFVRTLIAAERKNKSHEKDD